MKLADRLLMHFTCVMQHFLEKALSDKALAFVTSKLEADEATTEEVVDDDNNCTSSFHKKRLMKRYLKEEGSTALPSTSCAADRAEGGATLVDQLDDSSLGDASALRVS